MQARKTTKKQKYLVGVDLGGTTIITVVTDIHGKVIASVKCLSEVKQGVTAVINRIVDTIYATVAKAKIKMDDIVTIGLGAPGPLSTKTGVVFDAPNLNGWVNVPLRDLVRKALHINIPIFLDNDANAAAYGEFWVGAGKKVSNFIMLTLGTGIGGGIIIDKKLYRGPDDTAGELGHMTVFPNGPVCNCGNRGCLEAIASATGMVNRAVDALRLGSKSLIRDLAGNDLNKVTAKMIYEAVLQGDQLAKGIMEETGRYIGIAAASLVNIFNPEMIVFSGGMVNAGNYLLNPIREEVKKRAFPQPAKRVKIKRASLGENAGAIGAAGIAYSELTKQN
ncbi:MAG: ROK family protein [bacterium]|nr:ROK family protein [bacterium]